MHVLVMTAARIGMVISYLTPETDGIQLHVFCRVVSKGPARKDLRSRQGTD